MELVSPDILIINDDPENGKALKLVLQDLGGEIIVVTSAEEGLELIQYSGRKFALVVLDVGLSGIGGVETARRIRRHHPPLNLPIIFLSDHPSEAEELEGYCAGGVDYIAMPYPSEILRSKARIFVEMFLAREALSRREQFFHAVAAPIPEVIYLFDVVAGRNIFMNREISSIFGYSPEKIRSMNDSNMEALVHPDDYTAYRSYMEGLRRVGEGEIQHHEFRMRHADGKWRWISSQMVPFSRVADGSLHTFIGTVQDVTAQHEAHHRATQLEQRIEEKSLALGEA